MSRDRLDDVYWALRIGLGATATIAGADKFTNLLTHWRKYLAPEFEDRMPIDGETYMKLVGVVEMAVGAGVLTRQKWAPWAAAAWLCCIATDLIVNKDYDIAVRDLNMAIGAFALARMEQVRESRRLGSPDSEILPDAEPQVA
jgi:hypothetical protein